MKLTRPKSSSSFYESFSDLIFATMAIFVMLLVVFISQIGSDEEKLNFTGSSAETYSLIIHANVNDEPSVIFFPVDIANRFNIHRDIALNDPLLDLCKLAFSAPGIQSIPIREYVKMGKAFSQSFALGIRSQGEGTIETNILLNAINSTSFNTAEELKAAVFGPKTLKLLNAQSSESTINVKPPFIDYYHTTRKWLQKNQSGNLHSWLEQSRKPIRDTSIKNNDGLATVEFSTTDAGMITIGSAVISTDQFKSLLASISAGKNFILRHIDETQAVTSPPAWVMEEILIPTGYSAVK